MFIYPRISNVKLCNSRKWGNNLEKWPPEFKTVQGARLWTEENFLIILRGFYNNFCESVDNKLVVDCDMISLEEMFNLIKVKVDLI